MTESDDHVRECVLCHGELSPVLGHDPWPLADSGLCCLKCHERDVAPARERVHLLRSHAETIGPEVFHRVFGMSIEDFGRKPPGYDKVAALDDPTSDSDAEMFARGWAMVAAIDRAIGSAPQPARLAAVKAVERFFDGWDVNNPPGPQWEWVLGTFPETPEVLLRGVMTAVLRHRPPGSGRPRLRLVPRVPKSIGDE